MLTKAKALLAIMGNQIADIWNKSKIYLLGIVAIIAALEFQKIKAALLVYAGKKEIQKDQKQDDVLAKTESTDNAQADALVKDAENLPSTEKPVTEDWYKKDQS